MSLYDGAKTRVGAGSAYLEDLCCSHCCVVATVVL